MPTTHTVKQGEHIARLALEAGLPTVAGVWDHPDNADLREERGNPNVLLPGDTVVIPDVEQRVEPCATEKRHTFRLKRQKLSLRLAVQDATHQPITEEAARLFLENTPAGLVTDDRGLLETLIPANAEVAAIEIGGQKIPVLIGHLDPVEEESGWVARLNNLGYSAGPIKEPDPKRRRSALEEFQCDNGLKVDGKPGEATLAKLKEIHGC